MEETGGAAAFRESEKTTSAERLIEMVRESVRRFLLSSEDKDDLEGDVLLALTQIKKRKGTSFFSFRFIDGVALRVAANNFRKIARRGGLKETSQAGDDLPDHRSGDPFFSAKFNEAVASLPIPEQMVIDGMIRGMTVREIADEGNQSVHFIRKTIKQAKKDLDRRIGKD